MVLVPLLHTFADLEEDAIFPASVSIILPMCFVTLFIRCMQTPLPWGAALPYLIGSCVGGLLAGWLGKYIPTRWLHKLLGILILYGGWRYLC